MSAAARELRVFIADDEAPARARLKELLADVRASVATTVAGEAGNGRRIQRWILKGTRPVESVTPPR